MSLKGRAVLAKFKITNNDVNQGSLQTDGSQAELGLQRVLFNSHLAQSNSFILKVNLLSFNKKKIRKFHTKILDGPLSQKTSENLATLSPLLHVAVTSQPQFPPAAAFYVTHLTSASI